MKQSDVADILGISQQSISKLERYDANPRLTTLQTYANAVGASLEILVHKDDGQIQTEHAENDWEVSDKLPPSAQIHSSEQNPNIRPAHDWTERNTYELDSKRLEFAVGA